MLGNTKASYLVWSMIIFRIRINSRFRGILRILGDMISSNIIRNGPSRKRKGRGRFGINLRNSLAEEGASHGNEGTVGHCMATPTISLSPNSLATIVHQVERRDPSEKKPHSDL